MSDADSIDEIFDSFERKAAAEPHIDFAAEFARRWSPWLRWLNRFAIGRLVIKITSPDGKSRIEEQQIVTVQTARGPWKKLGKIPSGKLGEHAEVVGVIYENPKLPKLPATLARANLPGAADDFDLSAPWTGPPERAWISGFDGKQIEFEDRPRFPASAQRATWEGGRDFAKTKAGQAYAAYLSECRSILRKSGWAEDEIP